VEPNVGVLNPGESSPIKVTMNVSKEPKKELLEPDKFQIQSIIVPMDSSDKKVPKPQDDNFLEFIRKVWSNSNARVYKERIKIILKKPDDKITSTALSKDNGTNLLSRSDNMTNNRASRSNSSRVTENILPRNGNIISSTRGTELSRNPEIRDLSQSVSRSISRNRTNNDNKTPNEIASTDILRDSISLSRSISRSSSISEKKSYQRRAGSYPISFHPCTRKFTG